jgi:hypothetical protein
MKTTGLEDIRELFREIGVQLGTAIGESMIQAVRAQLPRLREELASGALGGSGSPPSYAPPAARRTVAQSSRGAKVSAALTRPCPVPGCTRPGRGPRFSFLCDVHREMPASDREKYRIRPKR